MAKYFGTDGIRGIANEDLNCDLAFKCGNALAQLVKNPLVVLGKDTRLSKDMLFCAIASGIMSGGGNVIDVEVMPTAGVAFLTKKFSADFGVVLSASHNSAEFNGIKIFDKNGFKLLEEDETLVENKFSNQLFVSNDKIGHIIQKDAINQYEQFLQGCINCNLSNLKIVLDCSNGASENIAPTVFENLGANIIKIGVNSNGKNINENCGSLHPEILIKKVLEEEADVGFAFDGDSDRILAVDENGNIVDGDQIIYILAKQLKKNNNLKRNSAVGTSHTNMGIQNDLKQNDITLYRSDIGDKYVLELMQKEKLNLGGEQSGHVILLDYATTGDGILTALKLAEILAKENVKLSELTCKNLFMQENINILVKDKIRIMNSELLSNAIENEREKLKKEGRIMVRASGTEPKIRVMVETQSSKKSKEIANKIINFIKELNF